MIFPAFLALIIASVLSSGRASINIKDVFVAKPSTFQGSGWAMWREKVTSTGTCSAPPYLEPTITCSSSNNKFTLLSSSVTWEGNLWRATCTYQNTRIQTRIRTTVTTTATCYYQPEPEVSLCSPKDCAHGRRGCYEDTDCPVSNDPSYDVHCLRFVPTPPEWDNDPYAPPKVEPVNDTGSCKYEYNWP